MNTTIRFLLCAVALAVLPSAPLRATDPPPGAGKVLLLDNERVLQGDIERVGDQYRVRRSTGETWVPADKALRLCASLEEALTYLRRRANLNDPDERLRLARWCHFHDLSRQAMEEVKAAVELRPDHAESRRLLRNLEQAASTPPALQQRAETTPEPEAPTPDLSAESICAFRARVQPILMNACANCHATGHGGAFKLTRVYDEGLNRRTVQRNLAAVLAQVNVKLPQGSALLSKAVSAHGTMTQAPLQNRRAPAFRMLEDWVQQTVAANPHLLVQDQAAAPLPAGPKPVADAPPVKAETPVDEKIVGSRFVPATPVNEAPAGGPSANAAGPVDPFDAGIFNRQMHPGKRSGGKRP